MCFRIKSVLFYICFIIIGVSILYVKIQGTHSLLTVLCSIVSSDHLQQKLNMFSRKYFLSLHYNWQTERLSNSNSLPVANLCSDVLFLQSTLHTPTHTLALHTH